MGMVMPRHGPSGGIDAMDSPPCPNCEKNKNGIFTGFRNKERNEYHCFKCGFEFVGPSPEEVRERRLHRHRQNTKHEEDQGL